MRFKMIVGVVLVVTAIVPLASLAQTSKKANPEQKNNEPKKSKEIRKKSISKGSKLYAMHCASCHAAGGNSVAPRKPVKGSQVLSTLATFKSYLNEPIGDMPHYEHLITDEKLLGDLYAYVKSL